MVIFTLLTLGVVVAIMAWVAMAMLRPLDEAAKRQNARVQFTLLDFLCLFLWIQAPMALIHGLLTEEPTARWVWDLFAWIALGALWCLSVQRLSQAGITAWKQRGLMLAFVIPMTLLAMAAVPATFVAGFEFVGSVLAIDSGGPGFLPLHILLGVGVVAVLARLAAWLSNRILADVTAELEPAPERKRPLRAFRQDD